MSIESRLAVAEALQTAGWAGTPGRLGLALLEHPSGAAWEITTEAGGCSLTMPDGGPSVDFRGAVPNSVVVAACLAAAGRLDAVPAAPVAIVLRAAAADLWNVPRPDCAEMNSYDDAWEAGMTAAYNRLKAKAKEPAPTS